MRAMTAVFCWGLYCRCKQVGMYHPLHLTAKPAAADAVAAAAAAAVAAAARRLLLIRLLLTTIALLPARDH
jgi:hypothetical protein